MNALKIIKSRISIYKHFAHHTPQKAIKEWGPVFLSCLGSVEMVNRAWVVGKVDLRIEFYLSEEFKV